MRIPRSPLFVPLLTSNSATVTICALVTPVRSRVTWFVPEPLLFETFPVPVLTDALLNETAEAKVTMI